MKRSSSFKQTLAPVKLCPWHGRQAGSIIKQLNSPTGMIINGKIYRELVKQDFHLDPETDNKSVYEPSALKDALDRYGDVKDYNVDEAALDEAFNFAMSQFGGKRYGGYLTPLSKESELLSAIKEEKSAGAPTFDKKGKAFVADLRRADRIVRDECAPPPCVAYHRIQHGEKGPKTRLVWGYPLSMTLIEATFARPLIDRFLVSRSPMAFGLRKFEIAARLSRFESCGVAYSLDYSKFDASINPKLIDMAFVILRTHFGEINEKAWDKIVWYFIHTPILMPDGYVWKKHRGVPSGSYFTQLVDSIVNFIAAAYTMKRATGRLPHRKHILVLGDDALIGSSEWVSLEAIASYAAEIGLSVNAEKSMRARKGDVLQFLGHYWIKGFPDRDLLEIAKRMAFPEVYSRESDVETLTFTRTYAYLADAVSAWKIVKEMDFVNKQQLVYSMFLRKRSDLPVTGWEEYQQSIGRGILDATTLAYEGPLL